MKKIIGISLLFFTIAAHAQYYGQQHGGNTWNSSGDQSVSGYTRSNGTYVESYHRSAPDSTQYNNYSASGNTNPYTGEMGHRQPKW